MKTRLSFLALACLPALALLWANPAPRANAAAPEAAAKSVRGVMAEPKHVTDEFLRQWKDRGANAIVVPVHEPFDRAGWEKLAARVAQQGLALYAWVEVARCPTLAEAHPDWLAAPGGHHDDWRRRFPNAPKAGKGEVVKAWPWVPIGYAPAFDAQQQRVLDLLEHLPGKWSGVFLNDLQGGPSSCGCGNDQCRWALDYGLPQTAPHTPGDDAAARLVAAVEAKHAAKQVIPVWVTECEQVDLPGAQGGTGLCGNVPCAKNDCWPRYARNWNPLVKATNGPIALAAWPTLFGRDRDTWLETALGLFQKPPRGGTPISPERTIAVLEGTGRPGADLSALIASAQKAQVGWVLGLDPIDQSWQPRIVPLDPKPARP